jgi:hypothetical protein
MAAVRSVAGALAQLVQLTSLQMVLPASLMQHLPASLQYCDVNCIPEAGNTAGSKPPTPINLCHLTALKDLHL